MRTRAILSLSILSVALIASGCSRNRAASSAPIPKSASAAGNDAAASEAAKLAEEAERAAAAERLAAERAAGDRELVKAAITTPVHFDFDQSKINDEGIRLLDQKVEALQKNPTIRIRIEGNADDYGSDEYNMVLSQRRAAVVNRYFTERGIDATRLQIVSWGEERPACKGVDEPCRAQNRRDEFIVVSGL
jgi:peptidoglycan-associated lipoprotein